MVNMLESGSQWLGEQLVAHASVLARYVRGGETRQINVVASDVTIEAIEEGTTVVAEATRFRVLAEDLVFGGQRVRPEPGDQISLWRGGSWQTYEVMSIGTQSYYAPADSAGTAWWIYGKLIEEA